jgi:hypothetical protein
MFIGLQGQRFGCATPTEDYDGQSLRRQKDRFEMEMPISGCKGYTVPMNDNFVELFKPTQKRTLS